MRAVFENKAVYFPQRGDNLGERMYHAISHVFDRKYDSCVLIGSDIPEIRAEHLMKAFFCWMKKTQKLPM